MPQTTGFKNTAIPAKERLIIALDVDDTSYAIDIVRELRPEVGAFKVGSQLFTAAGPEFVRELASDGIRIFLDLKFHDIPNTVAKAGIEAARLGVWMFNVHALGGGEMMQRTVQEVADLCGREKLIRPKIIAVTILTSADQKTMSDIGIEREIEREVVDLAKLASRSGMDGVVASPIEVTPIRDNIDDDDFLVVTPGVRPTFATQDDQKRVMTPGEAVAAGSDFLVIGRPITKAADRQAAVSEILREIESAA